MKKTILLSCIALLFAINLLAQTSMNIPSGIAIRGNAYERDLSAVRAQSVTVSPQQSMKEIEAYTFESFEGTFPPSGWTKQNPDGGTGWAQLASGTTPLPGWNGGTQTVPPGGGNNVAYCTWSTGGASANDQWLITPQFNVTSGDSLKFYIWRFGVFQDTVKVMLSTTTNTTSAFTTTLLTLDTLGLMPMGTWIRYKINLTPWAGQNIYIGFREKVSNNQTYGAYIALDMVSMGMAPPVDVGAVSIDINNGQPGSIVPKGTVMNYGSTVQTFNVILSINPGGYTSTQTVTNLGPGLSQQVTFTPNWTPTAGTYAATMNTMLSGDANTTNNTVSKTIHLYSIGKKSYCYVAYDPTGVLSNGPAIMDLNSPATIIQLADQSGSNFIAGGTWAGSLWLGVEYGSKALIRIDTLTGARTTIAILDSAMNGLTYDRLTSTLFGVSSKRLFAINPITGAQTLKGVFGIANAIMINLACHPATGQLYGVEINTDSLYAINKTNGLATIVGGIGFNSSYAQDMEFDYYTNTCYLAAYNAGISSGQLRSANLSTGATTLVGTFAGGAEITGLAIPYTITVGINESDAVAAINVFPNPASDFLNVDCSEDIVSIQLFNTLGQVMLDKKVCNTFASLNISGIADGIYILMIHTNKGIVSKNMMIGH